ncbi:MAG: polymer-forming cytoskeletal protein [Phycisphaerales bacterium]
MAKAPRKKISRGKVAPRRTITCYLCGHAQEVSGVAMSTTCPKCHKAIRIEDLIIKSYTPVNDLETCGRIHVTKRGRVAAKRIRAGDGIECEGAMQGAVETPGDVTFGPKAEWKGPTLRSRTLVIADGVKIDGHISVPWLQDADASSTSEAVVEVKQMSKAMSEDVQSPSTNGAKQSSASRSKRPKAGES